MLLGVALLAATAGAQTAKRIAEAIPEELTLDRAIEILRKQNPLLAAEREREAAAAGELEQARKLPNPAFSLETESFEAIQGDPPPGNCFFRCSSPSCWEANAASAPSLPGRFFARRKATSGPSSGS